MNPKTSLLAIALLALVPTIASAVDPVGNGALAVPANRIVGLWSTQGAVGPCGTNVFPIRVLNTLLFHAGGTVVEMPRFPPNGVVTALGTSQRGQALGTWSYNPNTQQYSMHLQFDWFVNNAYHGYATVDREILLSNGGEQAAGPVRSTRYAANGSTISEVCGSAVSTRL